MSNYDWFDYHKPAPPARITSMPPRAEVIEYTHLFGPDSTSVKTVLYNQNTRRLTVEFTGGGTYSYDGVSPQKFRALRKAESTGKYIRGNFTAAGFTGTKHGERWTPVEVAVSKDAPSDGGDLDKLKIERLTTGEGDVFNMHFRFEGTSTIEVRAADTKAAIALVKDYFADSGLTITLTKAEIKL